MHAAGREDVATVIELFDLDDDLAAAVVAIYGADGIGLSAPPESLRAPICDRLADLGIVAEVSGAATPRSVAEVVEAGWKWREREAGRLMSERLEETVSLHRYLVSLGHERPEVVGERAGIDHLNFVFAELMRGVRHLMNAIPVVGTEDVRGILVRSASSLIREANGHAASSGTRTVNVVDRDRLRQYGQRQEFDATLRNHAFPYLSGRAPLRTAILDNEVLLLPVMPERPSSGILVVRSEAAAQAASALMLGSADAPSGTNSITLDVFHAAVLTALTAGDKDEAIARRLVVSDRTVRRAVASLMTTLGAESRFQLAVKAARVGLI